MRVLLVLCLLLVPAVAAVSSAPEGPHLLVRVTQTAGASDVFVNVSAAIGETPFASEHAYLREGATFELPVARVGRMYVSVDAQRDGGTPLERNYGMSGVAIDSTGCPGSYLVAFVVTAADPNEDTNGCTVRPPAFDALAAQARDAMDARGGRGAVDVPLPRDGDRGVLLADARLDPTPSDERSAVPFEMRAASARDAWGRSVAGVEASYTTPYGGVAGAFAPLQPFVSEATFNVTDHIRWSGRDTDVTSWTRALPSARVTGRVAAAEAQLDQHVLYRAPVDMLHCALRHAAQGARIEGGDRVESVCPFLATSWRAGAPTSWRGLRAMPLYAIDASGAYRMVLAQGVPYPVELESWTQDPATSIVSHRVLTLDRLAAGGAPIDPPAAPAAPQAVARSPVDPLAGPRLADARGRFAYPLDQAVADARTDPTLQRARPLLARSDVVLAGAVLDLQQQDAGGPRTLRWWLVFSAPSSPNAGVLCERAGVTAGPFAPLAPVARCSEPDRAPDLARDELGDVPTMGRTDAPTMGASFDDAVTRFDGAYPDDSGAALTFAAYRAWAPASLAVGVAIPSQLAPSPVESQAHGSRVALDLGTGRTSQEVASYRRVPGLGPVPQGIAGATLDRPANAPLSGVGIPLLVGAGVAALAILALLAWGVVAMYSRLTRADVIEGPLRAQILDVVRDEPGIHASGILARLGRANGVGEHHLAILVREGFLTRIESPGFRRYFVTGRFSHSEMRALAALRDGQNEKLFRIIQSNPGIHLTELAQRAGISLAYASRTVAKLHEAGLVDRVQVGRTVTLHALER